jgi:hypothetical protein
MGTAAYPTSKGAKTTTTGETTTSSASVTPVLMIFVIEATAMMACSYSEILVRYVVPMCYQAKTLGQKKAEFALITYGGYPPSFKRTIDKTSFTFDLDHIMKQLSQLECAGTSPEQHALSDAFMCVLEVKREERWICTGFIHLECFFFIDV